MCKTKRVYYRLVCDHIRIIDLMKIDLVVGKTKVYCRQCEKLSTVSHRAEQA